jgi:hypothetical protein
VQAAHGSGFHAHLGYSFGRLTRPWIRSQETHLERLFTALIPRGFKRSLIRQLSAFRLRKLPDEIPEDLLVSISGLADGYERVPPASGWNAYRRMLDLHALHDVSQRFVDPGAFVAPGTPVVTVVDGSRLRISVTVAPDAAGSLRPGGSLRGTIENEPVDAVVEGVAPTSTGALYTVNAIVANDRGGHPTGGAATLRIPQGTRTGVLIPEGALVREGDLTGVRIQTAGGLELRWVRLGLAADGDVEVLSGLRTGDRVFVPQPAEGGR